jgi:rhomboid protease GluP
MMASAPAVTVILVVNVVFFFLQQFVPGLTQKLFLEPVQIAAGEWWRLLTPIVLHGGLLHLFFNCYVLFMLGPNVEQAFGTTRFIAMYVAAGLLASAFSFAFPPDVPSLGASGSIFGIAGVLFVYLFKRRRSQFVRGHLRQIAFFIGINLLFGFTGIFAIDNYAHIGGLVGGLILGFGFDREDEIAPVTSLLATLVVLGLAVLLIAGRIGGLGPFG